MSPGYPDTAPSGDRETTDDISGMNSCSLPSVSTRHSTPFINAIFISGTDMRSEASEITFLFYMVKTRKYGTKHQLNETKRNILCFVVVDKNHGS